MSPLPTSDDRDLGSAILNHWRGAGVGYRPGASPDALAEFERARRVTLPPDVRSYLLAADGMAPNEYDEHHFRFWPLHEFERVASGRWPWLDHQAFAFADFLIDSHRYAMKMTDATADVAIVGGPDAIVVASSFAEFVSRYLHDPDALLDPGADVIDTRGTR